MLSNKKEKIEKKKKITGFANADVFPLSRFIVTSIFYLQLSFYTNKVLIIEKHYNKYTW